MKVLAGYTDDAGSRAALGVAAMLAGRDALTVCTVTPESWGYPSLARVDAEYAQFLQQRAQDNLAAARSVLGAREAQYVHQSSGSVTQGLIDAAAAHGAQALVLGAAREPGLERFVTGSATEALLHCSPLPVVIAPRDGVAAGARLDRVSVAFSGDPRAAATVQRAAALAAAEGVPLRIVTMVVRDQQMYPSTVGYDAENIVANQWRVQAAEAQAAVREALPANVDASTALGDGMTWPDALASLDWRPGEVLLLGSSPLSLVERVFLGSNAKRIMQAASVPVVVVPRSAA